MSEQMTGFRTVMRGYEPAEVDRRINELLRAMEAQRNQASALAQEVERLRISVADATGRHKVAPEPPKPTFESLGERIGQILTLAEQEASHIRDAAAAEAEAAVAKAEGATAAARHSADAYVADTRAEVEGRAARIVEDAQRAAGELIAEAERQSAGLREEAQTLFDHEKARSAQAAAEFELALAARREQAELEIRERSAASDERLKLEAAEVARFHAESEQVVADAKREASRQIAEAEQHAGQIVSEAVARSERLSAESERDLLATIARRDAINAQLANVRQLLATLSGTSSADTDLAQMPLAVDPVRFVAGPGDATGQAPAQPAQEGSADAGVTSSEVDPDPKVHADASAE